MSASPPARSLRRGEPSGKITRAGLRRRGLTLHSLHAGRTVRAKKKVGEESFRRSDHMFAAVWRQCGAANGRYLEASGRFWSAAFAHMLWVSRSVANSTVMQKKKKMQKMRPLEFSSYRRFQLNQWLKNDLLECKVAVLFCLYKMHDYVTRVWHSFIRTD